MRTGSYMNNIMYCLHHDSLRTALSTYVQAFLSMCMYHYVCMYEILLTFCIYLYAVI